MNRKRAASLVILLLSVFICFPVFAEESRPLYIGDPITLEIQGGVSEDEIRTAFEEFELIDLKENQGTYTVTVRQFKAGSYDIFLGNTDMSIHVASITEEQNISEIVEASLAPVNMKNGGILIIILGLSIGTGLISLIALIIRYWRNRPKRMLTPYKQFLHSMEHMNDKDMLVEMTGVVKEFLQRNYQLSLQDLTTLELQGVIMTSDIDESYKELLMDWFREVDDMKYNPSVSEDLNLCKDLKVNIINTITKLNTEEKERKTS